MKPNQMTQQEISAFYRAFDRAAADLKRETKGPAGYTNVLQRLGSFRPRVIAQKELSREIHAMFGLEATP